MSGPAFAFFSSSASRMSSASAGCSNWTSSGWGAPQPLQNLFGPGLRVAQRGQVQSSLTYPMRFFAMTPPPPSVKDSRSTPNAPDVLPAHASSGPGDTLLGRSAGRTSSVATKHPGSGRRQVRIAGLVTAKEAYLEEIEAHARGPGPVAEPLFRWRATEDLRHRIAETARHV